MDYIEKSFWQLSSAQYRASRSRVCEGLYRIGCSNDSRVRSMASRSRRDSNRGRLGGLQWEHVGGELAGLAVAALLHERVIAAQAHPTVITRNLPDIAPTAPLECACMATECRSPEDRGRALSSIGSRHRDKIRRGANGASEQDVPPAQVAFKLDLVRRSGEPSEHNLHRPFGRSEPRGAC